MKIHSNKIPLKLTNLPLLVEFINSDNDKLLNLVISRLEIMEGYPASSNASFKQISQEMKKSRYGWSNDSIGFSFYTSLNYFIGHNVISYASHDCINYNTRFHSASTFTLEQWIGNFFHETTHICDSRSMYSFSHSNQKDSKSAPFVIGDLATELYKKNY